ncbi:DUF4004 family protein [Paenibacillus nanensis]|uniref:DUF4004 family protein n=1 Tax=Paenibacillus nanensis TaxID=393251 RepID=A0A3A1VKP8_9BACL|nr:YhbD family protein [Paenibacillus nanensis]RIX60216.1 DUF4004 family protein [Paenibacillus nanensis]
MDSDLISKKELLDVTGISYGQLYRWKRKQLIPEAWFIRKSAYTGQETFFPRELILSRIDKILNLKDDVSLDELAERLSGQMAGLELRKRDFLKLGIVSADLLKRWAAKDDDERIYAFEEMLFFQTAEALLRAGTLQMEEGGALLAMLNEHYAKFKGQPCDLIVFRRMGAASFALVESETELYFDGGIKAAARLAMSGQVEQLKGMLV